jgi:hypothetical protein
MISPTNTECYTNFDSVNGNNNSKEEAKPETWQMVKIVWTDSASEYLIVIGESWVELPEPKPEKK